MQIQDFVTGTLKQIIDGVHAAQNYANTKDDSNAVVNPVLNSQLFCDPTEVSFDLAVTTTESNEVSGRGEGGGTIKILSAKAGAEVSNSSEKENISRVKFSVKVSLPSTPKTQFTSREDTKALARGRTYSR